MTLHGRESKVGVRELHDRLSEHLDRVERGTDVVVTRRGRPIARLTAIGAVDPLDELIRRGFVMPATEPRRPRHRRAKSRGSVSELVTDQRR